MMPQIVGWIIEPFFTGKSEQGRAFVGALHAFEDGQVIYLTARAENPSGSPHNKTPSYRPVVFGVLRSPASDKCLTQPVFTVPSQACRKPLSHFIVLSFGSSQYYCLVDSVRADGGEPDSTLAVLDKPGKL